MTENKSQPRADERPATQSEKDRLERQGAALRANLQKRKQQNRARNTSEDAPTNDPKSDTQSHD